MPIRRVERDRTTSAKEDRTHGCGCSFCSAIHAFAPRGRDVGGPPLSLERLSRRAQHENAYRRKCDEIIRSSERQATA